MPNFVFVFFSYGIEQDLAFMAQQWEKEMSNFSFGEKDKFIEWAPCSLSKTPVMAVQTEKKTRRRPGKESRRRNQIRRRQLQREYILGQ